ncbi:uncharacterized protein JCM6883_002459 [Sporobolomyces salmoneus]|uniref:uncharacterized protein n=1 Tax=Sporobolomyces salmoneus TaxID=183962 RepID=UPI00318051E8
MSPPDFTPLRLVHHLQGEWWCNNKEGGPISHSRKPIPAVRDAYMVDEKDLPESFTVLWCNWCSVHGKASDVEEHMRKLHVNENAKPACEGCHIAWTPLMERHKKKCPARHGAAAEELAGRTWRPRELAYSYDDSRIYQIFCIEVAEARKSITLARNEAYLKQNQDHLKSLQQKLAPEQDPLTANNLQAEIKHTQENIVKLERLIAIGTSASLSKISTPVLTARQRVVYHDLL